MHAAWKPRAPLVDRLEIRDVAGCLLAISEYDPDPASKRVARAVLPPLYIRRNDRHTVVLIGSLRCAVGHVEPSGSARMPYFFRIMSSICCGG